MNLDFIQGFWATAGVICAGFLAIVVGMIVIKIVDYFNENEYK